MYFFCFILFTYGFCRQSTPQTTSRGERACAGGVHSLFHVFVLPLLPRAAVHRFKHKKKRKESLIIFIWLDKEANEVIDEYKNGA